MGVETRHPASKLGQAYLTYFPERASNLTLIHHQDRAFSRRIPHHWQRPRLQGFALAHRWTERRIRASGLGWTILRNGLYAELFASLLAPSEGVITAPFGTGAVAVVTRADLAEAAANVAAHPDRHIDRVYDLVGPKAIAAQQIAQDTGLLYRPVSLGSHRVALEQSGLLPFQPAMILSICSSVASGLLTRTTTDLSDLLGRTPTDAEPTVVRAASRRDAA